MVGFEIKRAKPRLLIGVDPGSNCGVATLIPGSKCLNLYQTKSNIEAMFLIIELANDYEIELFIEDARLAKKNAYFARKDNHGKLQGVGYVKGFSKEWEAFCKIRMFKFTMLQSSNTKMDPILFEKMTGLKTLKTEHHKRDAAMIILGRK
jgi:hypothetical protein